MDEEMQMSGTREFLPPSGALTQAPISSAVRIGDWILVSGQIAIDESGAVITGGVGAESRACLESVKTILQSMGSSLADVVQTRIFLTDFTGYNDFNAVYREYFAEPFPTRSTVGTPELALGATIEIEAIAVTAGAT